MELENKLKTEIKARNRAEKRLKFLMKKLQSLKIPFSSEESEPSVSSDNSEISCKSSITSSASKDPEEKIEKPDPTTLSQESFQLQSNPTSEDPNNHQPRYLFQT